MPDAGDPPIAGLLSDVVWRRIPPWHFPKKKGRTIPHSPAFDDDEDGPMSVVMARPGRAPEEILLPDQQKGWGVVSLRVADLVALGLQVVPDPEDEEPDHALVLGKKTDGTKRTMSKQCVWLIPDPPPCGE